MNQNIVLFDGNCGFCNRSIQFIIKHDHKNLFSFASLQSKIGETLLIQHHLPQNYTESIVLITNTSTTTKAYTHHHAAFLITQKLGGFFTPIFYLTKLIPNPIALKIYKFIAQNRLIFFKNTNCIIPTTKIKQKFL